MLHDVLSLFHLFLLKQPPKILDRAFFFKNTYNFIFCRSGRY